MKYLKGLVAAITLLLFLFLGAGALISGEWSSERSIRIEAEAEAVWPWIADLRQWDAWAPLGEVEGIFPAETRGVGATREWDDAAWGEGVVTVRDVEEGRRLVYDVAVDGGLSTTGTLTVEAGPEGSTVTWLEEGDFGWNPLLTWFASGMDVRQGAQLEQGLEKLRNLIESGD